MRQAVILAAFVLLPTGVYADSISCAMGSDVRHIAVVDAPKPDVLCEVLSSWPRIGLQKVLWYSRNNPDFCDKKAMESQAILENAGWSCIRHGPIIGKLKSDPVTVWSGKRLPVM